MRSLKIVWNLPNTMLGFIVLLFLFFIKEIKNVFVENGAIICVLPTKTTNKCLQMFFESNMSASIGNIVFISQSKLLKQKLLAHEIAHVQQSEILGVFYFPFYVICYIAILLIGQGDPKFDHPLEIMARRKAGQIIDILGAIQKLKQK